MKLIVRIKGGLGNQLFSYAAARRLAINNNAELVIDNTTGFQRDFEYQRNYALNNFSINARIANRVELLEPFGLLRRRFFREMEKLKPFLNRLYIEQQFPNYDSRLIDFNLHGVSYIDGLWQSEAYFKDVENIIREDLRIVPPDDYVNLQNSKLIKSKNSIGIHIRRFDKSIYANVNIATVYYKNAIELIKNQIIDPFFIIFSDDIVYAKQLLNSFNINAIYINNNVLESRAYVDLWLMTLCKHFIMANSTFSWWGAWLGGDFSNRLIYFPRLLSANKENWAWDYDFQMPKAWIPISI